MGNSGQDKPGVIALPPLIYLGFFAIGVGVDSIWPVELLPQTVQYVAGAAIIAASGVIVVSTLRLFRRARTPFDVRKPASVLITDGVFRLSRNPGYVALTLLCVGLAILIDTLWVFVLLVPALVVMHYGVIIREERYLERRFGDEYLRYKASVRRWF